MKKTDNRLLNNFVNVSHNIGRDNDSEYVEVLSSISGNTINFNYKLRTTGLINDKKVILIVSIMILAKGEIPGRLKLPKLTGLTNDNYSHDDLVPFTKHTVLTLETFTLSSFSDSYIMKGEFRNIKLNPGDRLLVVTTGSDNIFTPLNITSQYSGYLTGTFNIHYQ